MNLTPLMKAAMIAVRDCMGAQPGENALVVTDTGKLAIAESFLYAFHSLGIDATLIVMTPRDHHAQEPPPEVRAAMLSSAVALLITTKSLTHTHARVDATNQGVRIASLPGITEDIMTVGAMTADYQKVSELSWKLTKLMESTQKVEITTELGTHLVMSLIGRKPGLPPDDGIYREKGRWGNLPAGEAYIAPVEESVNGVVIVDGSQSPLGLLSAPIRITIQDGRAIKFEGGAEAAQFERHLQSLDDPNAYWVAELGIGTNEKARVTGNILEDEKAFRTIHIAFGMNTDMGGKIESKTHDDGIVTNPTVKFDGKTIMDRGNFVV